MKKLLIAGVAVAAVAGIAPALALASTAQTATAPKAERMLTKTVTRADVTQRVQQHFTKFDADRDGFVTKAEADAAAAVRQRVDQQIEKRGTATFDKFDANKDGAISRAEFEAAREQWTENMMLRRGKRGMHHAGLGGRMFEMADADKDGNVSLAEATNAALARFDAADANRDGTLTREEMRQARQRMKGSAPRS